MKRTLQEVRTFKERIYCDCGGEYVWNGICLTTYPAQYPHVCSNEGCLDKMTMSGQSYPREITQEVGEEYAVPDE